MAFRKPDSSVATRVLSASFDNRAAALIAVVVLSSVAAGSDWPMACFDAGRRAASPQVLADKLVPQWIRELPPLTPAWPDQPKMQFDQAYDPVVMCQSLFVASSKHDWVASFDTRTGKENWRFYAEGPVRFAPLAWKEWVYFVSDDGHLYCLSAADGALKWKHRGGPTDRKILGNERLVSTWPARGAPVIANGTIYFGSSIWPFMGIFIDALDARTGREIWANDGEGTNYIRQPHNTDSFATVAPQGHFAIMGDRLLVPGGRSIPALFGRLTGRLIKYQLAENGKKGGGSDVATAGSFFFNGGAVFDLASQKHLAELGKPLAISSLTIAAYSGGTLKVYDFATPAAPREEESVDRTGKKTKKTKWSVPVIASAKVPPLEDLIQAGDRIYAVAKGKVLAYEIDAINEELELVWQADVDGTPVRVLAADDRLFVVTKEGRLHCFGAEETKVVHHPQALTPLEQQKDEWTAKAAKMLEESKAREGYGVVLGIGTGRLIEELHAQSNLKLIVVDADANKVRLLRERIAAADLSRISVITGDITSAALPAYFASLIASETVPTDMFAKTLKACFHSLRPYGGTLALPIDERWGDLARSVKLDGAVISEKSGLRFLKRVGALAGAANWTHEHADAANTRVSQDHLVKAPLGILWFGGPANDGILPRHGHGPQPQAVDGRLIIEGVDLIRALDIYTGRLLWETPLPGVGRFYNNLAHQPGANASGSNFISTPDGIYVAWEDRCVKLNVETGKIEAKFELPPTGKGKSSPLWGYINVEGDYLIGGADPILDRKNLPLDPKKMSPDFGADKDPDEKKSDITSALSRLLKSVKAFNDNMSASKRLVVLDRHTGKALWSVEANNHFRHNATIVGGDKLFTIDRLSNEQLSKYKRTGEDPPFPSTLRVFDLKTGKELWSVAEDVFGTWLSYSEEHDILLESGRVARDSLLDEPKGMRAYDAATGSPLWFQKSYTGPAMILGDEVLQGQGGCDIKTGKQKMRIDPLTGLSTPWTWIRNYGCNTPAASRNLLTFRSGAAGFFDLCGDGGTGNLGGFRSSCTNNLVVAGGVMTVPDYTRTCTCSYQNQTSVGLIHMPEAEMWTVFGTKDIKGPIRRLGLNLGAPGDRRAADGTLWLEYPFNAGATPAVGIKTIPAKLDWYRRHSSSVEGDATWVCASGVRGIEQLTLTLDKFARGPKKYTVRLYFSEPEELEPGHRVFRVELQDQVVIEKLDIVKEAGDSLRSLVREFKGVSVHDELFLRLTPLPGSFVPSAVLSGLEIQAEEE